MAFGLRARILNPGADFGLIGRSIYAIDLL